MRWLVLCITASLCAQTSSLTPRSIRQGGTLKLSARYPAEAARFGTRKIPLFNALGETASGLMPIPIDAKPGAYQLEFLDKHDAVVEMLNFSILDAHYPKQNVVLSKSIAELKSSPEERESVNSFRMEEDPVRHWQEPLHLPIPGCMTSLFGVGRYINGKPTGEYHGGVDQRGAAGTPIHPVTEGTVKLASQYSLRGGTVAVDHGQGLSSIYLHMSQVLAKPGDHVKPSDVLGLVGSTGRSTAPHLHWTLYVHGEPVNPNQWVRLAPCTSRSRVNPKSHSRVSVH